jgi:Ran GTPase-activating protein (RanGAP) involved in mRNA processing and transport
MMMKSKRFYILEESKNWFIIDKLDELHDIKCYNGKRADELCDFLNYQEYNIKILENKNEELIKLAKESIHKTSDEKNKIIYELYCNSINPLPIKIPEVDNIKLDF